MSPLRVAVVGAGPAGLTAALCLVRGGADVEIFEASGTLGGLARSTTLWGYPVDLGPHVVAGGSPDAVALWEQLAGHDFHELPVRRGVLTGGRIIEYPPTPLELLRKLPVTTLARCASGFALARMRDGIGAGGAPMDAEGWMVRRFGRALYETLFEQYVEKLWGRPATSIDASFASSLVGAAGSPVSRAPSGGMRCRHPATGTGAVWDRMAAVVVASRGTIHLDTPVQGIVVEDGQVAGLDAGGVRRPFDHVHSTMPLRHLTPAIGAPPRIRDAVAALEARHVLLAHLLVEGAAPAAHLWVQVYDSAFRVGRITDDAAWKGGATRGPRVITLEYWCSDGDATWKLADEEIIRLAARELAASGLAPGAAVRAGHVTRLRGALPVPARGYTSQLDLVREHCAGIRGLSLAGRHGSHAVNSVIDNIDDGMRAAAQILEAAGRRPSTGAA